MILHTTFTADMRGGSESAKRNFSGFHWDKQQVVRTSGFEEKKLFIISSLANKQGTCLKPVSLLRLRYF